MDEAPAFKRYKLHLSSLGIFDHSTKLCDRTGVVLHRVDFGDEIEIYVAALGIGYPLYEELFPEHVAAYENQFNPQ